MTNVKFIEVIFALAAVAVGALILYWFLHQLLPQ